MEKYYAVAASVLLLSACAAVRIADQGYQSLVIKPDPIAPNISVSDGSVVVDQEPIVLTSANAALPRLRDGTTLTTITWALPWLSNYIFADDSAIDIVAYSDPGSPAPVGKTCGRKDRTNGKVFVCSYNTPGAGVKYKYTVSVKDTTGARVNGLDPTIWN